MNKITKFLLLSSLVIIPSASLISTIPYMVSNENLVNVVDNTAYSKKLKTIDLFKEWKKLPSNTPKLLKNKITEIVNKYRLIEWNEYYHKMDLNSKTKSDVLEPSWSNYLIDRTNKISRNKIFKDYSEKYYTKIYLSQDEQFRYFNNIINLLNEEYNENQPDFLYLRWLYYSYFASQKYHNVMYRTKHIYDITITDWTKAISIAIASAGTKTTDLIDLIKTYLEYYGINPSNVEDLVSGLLPSFGKTKNAKMIFNLNVDMLDKCIFHAYLCSKDMVMRYSTIPNYDFEHYQLLELKAKRAKKINDEMFKYYSILTDIFDKEISEEDIQINKDELTKPDGGFQPVSLEAVKSIMNQIKKAFMEIIDEIGNLSSLKKMDYLNK